MVGSGRKSGRKEKNRGRKGEDKRKQVLTNTEIIKAQPYSCIVKVIPQYVMHFLQVTPFMILFCSELARTVMTSHGHMRRFRYYLIFRNMSYLVCNKKAFLSSRKRATRAKNVQRDRVQSITNVEISISRAKTDCAE